MTIINTCRGRNIDNDIGVGTRIIAPPPLPIITQELTEATIIPSPAWREGGPIEVLIEGLADGTSGFAVFLRDWARHLAKYGVRVFIPPHIKSEYPEIVKMHDTKVTNPIQLTIIPGGCFPAKNPDRYTIGYTLFETNEFPAHFKNSAENLDSIWTGSKFCYERFVKVGIPKEKIEVFPVGVDTELFNPYIPPSLKRTKTFRFATVIGWSARKGIDILLKAFLKEFDMSDNVVLYVNGGWYAEKVAVKEVEEIKKEIGGSNFPKIELDWSVQTDFEMPSLFNSFDCFCLPSRGEGYGRTLAESSACEVPCITTDYGPMNEIINDSTGYKIDVERIGPEPRADWICDFYRGADFAHPSENHLRELMRTVYEDYDTAKRKAEKAREFVKANHNTATIIEKVVKRLLEVEK